MMTLEQQRIAIAEWSGWTNIEHGEATASPPYDLVGIDSNCVMSHTLMDKHQDNEVKPWKKYVPNYPLDLNAMHEAEKKLTTRQCREYFTALKSIIVGDKNAEPNRAYLESMLTSSELSILCHSQQRSEALCRTLWPERFE